MQDARIKAPNGLLADDTGDVLIVVDFTSGVLYSFNQKTKALNDIAEGFGGGDGLVHRSNGTMYVLSLIHISIFKHLHQKAH